MDPLLLLRDRFGYGAFLPGQRAVIDALLSHGRALAVFPTGGGKSICYQLPALALPGVTLVVSPLIALMKDQIDFLRGRGIDARRLDSSLSPGELTEVSEAMRAGTLKILYVAPERFNNERFLQTLERTEISLFAVDEAHCISEWGHNFRPDYLKLAETAKKLGVPRVLALTATATPAVVEDIRGAFGIPAEGSIVTGFFRQNLAISVVPARREARDGLLVQRLRERAPGPTIVYVTLQKTAERVAERLRREGMPAEAYHAGLESEARSAVQEGWMASSRGIVVATIAFGMGIDKRDVRYVYHYNLPKSLESYSQEIGRAGRDGLPSIVELLACPDDVPTLENFAYGDTPTGASLRSLLDELLGLGDEFDVALFELSERHDVRILVLRTALTYLELLGVLRQGTPRYAGYKVKPKIPPDEIAAAFRGEHARLVSDIFRLAKRGRTWFSLDPDEVAAGTGEARARIVRALEVLEERGHVELSASDVRHRFTRLPPESGAGWDAGALAVMLEARFSRREAQEIERLSQVLALVTGAGCLANALAAHFGEARTEPCGICAACVEGPRSLPLPSPREPLLASVDLEALAALRAAHSRALSEPRQVARFLVGLPSPALSRARLGRHPLAGALEEHPFAEVLAFCEALA